MEEKIRLIPKKRKGILRILFSRFLIILVLILLQIDLFISIIGWLKDYFPHFILFQTIFSVFMIVYLINCKMESDAKVTWLFIIMLMPIPGTFFLWFTRREFGHRAVQKRIEQLIGETRNIIPQDESLLSESEIKESCTDDLCRYINLTGCYPLYKNTDVRYFAGGEDKFFELLCELQKAEKYIFLEYFIIDEGYMWGSVLEILIEKVKQGVEVRVMYDGMCEISSLSYDYSEKLEKFGIKCKAFAPIRPFLSTHYNYRDHRKICVIDGKTAFTGGVNLADEYINRKERFGHWKDSAIMLRGEAVRSFTLLFLQMWNITEREPEWDKWLEYSGEKYTEEKGFVIPYGDYPLDNEKIGENVYIDILYRAKNYVHIMTPYLIIDGEMKNALEYAAKRGVDVKIILPGIPDKKTAFALAKSHYRELLDSGVKIYEYTAGFVHAKVFTSDDEKAVVGTINLDYRSLYHHFECAVYMFRTNCIGNIEKDFRETLKKCSEVTYETIKKEKLSYKIAGVILKVFAPLM